MEDSLKERFLHLPERLAGLGELASNLWWSWHPEARNLFRMLDLPPGEKTWHNPVKLLEALPASVGIFSTVSLAAV
jgi:starch phosphorylase